MEFFKRPFIIKCILITGIAAGIYFLFRWIVPLVIPFLIALFVAMLLQPCIRKLEASASFKHKTASMLVLLVFLVVFVAVGGFILKTLIAQGRNILNMYPFYQIKIMDGLAKCCRNVDSWFHLQVGQSYGYVETMAADFGETFSKQILPKLTTGSVRMLQDVFEGFIFVFVTFIATVVLTRDYGRMGSRLAGSRPGQWICRCGRGLRHAIGAYAKAQVVLMVVYALVLSVMLYLMGNSYFLILGIGIAILDALPMIGSGFVLIPWALLQLFMGEPKAAAWLFAAYVIVSCLREYLEPKLVGNEIGLSSIESLICMYVGLQLFGLFGLLFGSMAYLIGRELYVVILPELIKTEGES